MRKETEPPPDWRTFKFGLREFGQRLGIDGKVLNVRILFRDVEVRMWQNRDGSQDVYHLSRDELVSKLGLEGWKPWSAWVGLLKVEVRASPVTASEEGAETRA